MRRNVKIEVHISQRNKDLCLSTCLFYDKAVGNLPAYCQLFNDNLKRDPAGKNYLRCRKCKAREM